METEEMSDIRDEIGKNCKRLGTIGHQIDLAFCDRGGDPGWEISNLRELVNTIEQQISDYEKLNVINERLGGIGV